MGTVDEAFIVIALAFAAVFLAVLVGAVIGFVRHLLKGPPP